MSKIEFGMECKDLVSGFTGIATGRSEFLNGCVRWCLEPKGKTPTEKTEGQWFDEQQLRVVKTETLLTKIRKKFTSPAPKAAAIRPGGPRKDAMRRKDASRR